MTYFSVYSVLAPCALWLISAFGHWLLAVGLHAAPFWAELREMTKKTSAFFVVYNYKCFSVGFGERLCVHCEIFAFLASKRCVRRKLFLRRLFSTTGIKVDAKPKSTCVVLSLENVLIQILL